MQSHDVKKSFLLCLGDPGPDDASHHHLSRPHQHLQHNPDQLASGELILELSG